MQIPVLFLTTFVGYSLTAILQWRCLSKGSLLLQRLCILSMLGSLSLHGMWLHQLIDGGMGQNLAVTNLLSFFTWIMVVIVFLLGLRRPVINLQLFVCLIAAGSCLLNILFPGENILHVAGQPEQLIHIFLSCITFSVLLMSGLQAVVFAMQNKLMRIDPGSRFLSALPPLQTMERLCFQLIAIGFILLTMVLVSSLWFFTPLQSASILSKTILCFIGWSILLGLLIGHYRYGLRGTQMMRWLLLGVLSVFICSLFLAFR